MSHRPSDWPAAGPIDLALHDLPHASSATEWWYLNTHVTTADGREVSLFAAFFRLAYKKNEETGEVDYAHSLTWALTDCETKSYFAESWVDERAPEIGLERMNKGRGSDDHRVNRAMREVLEKGTVPLPDQMFDGPCFVHQRKLELDFGGYRLEKDEGGRYRLQLYNQHNHVGCDLIFTPQRPAIRHGEDGVVRGTEGEDMYYYFVPRCAVEGAITINGTERPVAKGDGWYDHEFGGHSANPHGRDERGEAAEHGEPTSLDLAWNWTAVQIEDGPEFSAYTMVEPKTGELHGQTLLRIDPDGTSTQFDDVILAPTRWWRSSRTFFDYPVDWVLQSKSAGVDLALTASCDDQELMTVMSAPSFWEGRCEVSGAIGGAEVSGLAYVERSGFEPLKNLDDFFGAVGEETRKSVQSHLPTNPTWEETRDMIASKNRPQYMDGVDPDELARVLADPVRLITDRGGKSWRSYAALACCDVVGGDSRKFVQWLAMPEFMHVGSLIVDDVQDKSTVRRGGPACHLVYGDALAINAGTACYFMGQKLLVSKETSDKDALRLYDLYFEALRAGHAGQAIDLDPKTALVAEAVRTGDAAELEARIRATHRLKTAAPAAGLARMGAVVGGGSEAEIEAVGTFFEALGLAFQIVDDVLNLRGFKGDLKTRGEDVRNGTITYPVAKALSRLDEADRTWLHQTLQSKPDDDAVVTKAVELMERCGAIEDSAQEAKDMVEAAWKISDLALRDSFPKIMLRAFSWYVLERHY